MTTGDWTPPACAPTVTPIAMKLDPLFLLLASVAIATPGPGVLMTVTNAVERGFRDAFHGILGLALGSAAIASLSASSLGAMLVASPAAFAAMKIAGAVYLASLGVRNWLAKPPVPGPAAPASGPVRRRFTQGVALQATNPQAIVFFLALLPQFVDARHALLPQYATLVLAFGVLLVSIHSTYAAVAGRARAWISSERSQRLVRRTGGTLFFAFAAMLVMR